MILRIFYDPAPLARRGRTSLNSPRKQPLLRYFSGSKQVLCVVGTEGTGHHAIRAALNPWITSESVDDEGRRSRGNWFTLIPQLSVMSLDEYANRTQRTRSKVFSPQPVRKLRSHITRSPTSRLFLSPSFPAGRHSQASSHVSFLDLCTLGCAIPQGSTLKTIWLQRPTSECAASVARRGITNDAESARERVAFGKSVLELQIACMRAQGWTVLPVSFHDLIRHPEATLLDIAKYADVPQSLIQPSAIHR